MPLSGGLWVIFFLLINCSTKCPTQLTCFSRTYQFSSITCLSKCLKDMLYFPINTSFGQPQALISEKAVAERNAVRNEHHLIELSPRSKGSSDEGNDSKRSVSSGTLSARMGSINAVDHNKKRGMVLPFTPLSITFDEIRYVVDMPQEMKAQGIPEDRLELLKGVSGGEEIYVGQLGLHCSILINNFEETNGVLSMIKKGYNTATWMLDITLEAQEATLGVNFAELYKNSDLYKRKKALIRELTKPPAGSKDLYLPTKSSRSFLTQCVACLWKQNRSYWRSAPYSVVRLLFTLFIALLFGTIFWNIGSKRERKQDVVNAMGSMYAAGLVIGVHNCTSVQPVVDIERTVFYRERAAGIYSALPYAFGQVAIEIPYLLLQTLVYGIIVYAMIGFVYDSVMEAMEKEQKVRSQFRGGSSAIVAKATEKPHVIAAKL